MRLLFFTLSFPFGKGEEYIQTEILFLSKYFDEIIIIPYCYVDNKELRPVPDNVTVLEPLMPEKMKQKDIYLKALFNSTSIFPVLRDIFTEKLLFQPKLLEKVLRKYFQGKYLAGMEVIKKLFDQYNKDTVAYFYWGAHNAWMIPFIRTKIPKVSRFHGYDLYKHRDCNNGYVPLQKAILKNLDYALVISQQGLDYLSQEYNSISFKSKIFRLGVVDNGLNQGSNDNILRIVSCSAMRPLKRIHLIIEALEKVNFEVEWTHIGDGPLQEDLQILANKLPSNIRYKFPGYYSNENLLKYYRENSIDLFINVSETEGLPVTIMEAMSSGIPIIATDVGGTAELVNNDCCKLLSPCVTSEELSDELKEFYIRQDTDMLRFNAKNQWENLVNAEKNYTEFAEFLVSLCK